MKSSLEMAGAADCQQACQRSFIGVSAAIARLQSDEIA